LDNLIYRVDAWVVSLVFAGSMLAFWALGWWRGRRLPADCGQAPETKVTDASVALLGLLLAFTFAMTLGRHDHRRLMVVAESNAIGDFYTCATLLKEPHRSALQATIRDYAQNEVDTLCRFVPPADQQKATQRSQESHSRMTDIVAQAVRDGTPIAICLTNTLNSVTSANASRLAAYEEMLPWSIQLLLLLGAIIPSFLMGRQKGATQEKYLSGTLSFIVLVSLVIFVTLDLNQPRRGLIRVNRESFDRLTQSIGK
jgi:hypothetical protein